MVQNMFTLAESWTYSSIEWGCSVSHICALSLLTLPVRWKVALSLNTRRLSNSSSSNITCIWVQKSLRAGLSVSFKCWSKCSLQMQFIRYHMQVLSYHLPNNCWRHLKFTTSSSDWFPGALLKDFSNSFDRLVEGDGVVLFWVHKHLSSLNFVCHFCMVCWSGGCFKNFVWNLHSTHVH